MALPSKEDYEYDVCLSFAGEQRDYVEKVAILLKEKKIAVFYDNFEKWRLWGSSLFKLLYDIYSHKAKYCIMFISKDYVEKIWTNVEFENILYRAAEGLFSKKYVLPVRFDNSEIPGLPRGIGYLDGYQYSPEEVADMFEQMLKANIDQRDVVAPVMPNDLRELAEGAEETIRMLREQFGKVTDSISAKFECIVGSSYDYPLDIEVLLRKKSVAHFAVTSSEHHVYFYLSHQKPFPHYSAFADVVSFGQGKKLILKYCDVDYDAPNSGIERQLSLDELFMLLWAGLCKMVERNAGMQS